MMNNFFIVRIFALLVIFIFSATVQAEIKIGGFATAGLIIGDTENDFVSGADVITESAAFGADNTLGLQVTADVNSKVNMTTQLIAKAVDDSYDVYAHWAYISYELSPDVTVRMGRMNFPGALFSEVQEVGFSYPWIRNPIEVYTLMPISSHSGFDVFYRFEALDIDWVMQSSVGSFPALGAIGATIEIDLAYGFSFSAYTDHGKWNLSIINTEDTNIAIPVGGTEVSINFDVGFATAGFDLEFGNIVVISEIMKKMIKNNPAADIYSKSDMLAYYLTLGYRMGDFIPHFTYGGSQSDHKPVLYPAGSALPGTPPSDIPAQYWVAPTDMLVASSVELFLQKSYTAGLRYDYSSQVALKFEVQRIVPDKGGWGVFYTDPGDKADLISMAVDVVF